MISEKLSIVDADTLLSTPLEKTLFIVEGLIPQGVTLLGGSSKIGKSWLMLSLGLRVARGLPLWGLRTQRCDVLYLSLEDTMSRLQNRLYCGFCQLRDEYPHQDLDWIEQRFEDLTKQFYRVCAAGGNDDGGREDLAD